jgi:hypothetical protein
MFKALRSMFIALRYTYRTGKRVAAMRAMAKANGTEAEFEAMLTSWLDSCENHLIRSYFQGLYDIKPSTKTAR